jgi:hypothetical protein
VCPGKWTDDSKSAVVKGITTTLRPVIPETMFECAQLVRVKDVPPQTWVHIFSDQLNPGLCLGHVYSGKNRFVDVKLNSPLIAGDAIHAEISTCDGQILQSIPRKPVQNLDVRPPAPKIPDIKVFVPGEKINKVRVTNIVPGATVTVFVLDKSGLVRHYRGHKECSTTEDVINILGTIERHDQVVARQYLCQQSDECPVGKVVASIPRITKWRVVNIEPSELSVQFEWGDEGIIDKREWDMGDGTPFSTNAHRYPKPGIYHAKYTVSNDQGSASISIAVEIKQNQPPGVVRGPDGFKEIHIYNCTLNNSAVDIWVKDLNMLSPDYDKKASSVPSEGMTCPRDPSDKIVIPLAHGHLYDILHVKTGCNPNKADCVEVLRTPTYKGDTNGPVEIISVFSNV